MPPAVPLADFGSTAPFLNSVSEGLLALLSQSRLGCRRVQTHRDSPLNHKQGFGGRFGKTYLTAPSVCSHSAVVLQRLTKQTVLVPSRCHPKPHLVTLHYRLPVQGETSAFAAWPSGKGMVNNPAPGPAGRGHAPPPPQPGPQAPAHLRQQQPVGDSGLCLFAASRPFHSLTLGQSFVSHV